MHSFCYHELVPVVSVKTLRLPRPTATSPVFLFLHFCGRRMQTKLACFPTVAGGRLEPHPKGERLRCWAPSSRVFPLPWWCCLWKAGIPGETASDKRDAELSSELSVLTSPIWECPSLDGKRGNTEITVEKNLEVISDLPSVSVHFNVWMLHTSTARENKH